MENWRREIPNEDSCQIQELSESLGISEQAISKRLKQLGMIQKEGYWVPHELKPKCDVEERLFAYEQLLERQTRKGFLHRIVTGGEKWCYARPQVAKSVVKKISRNVEMRNFTSRVLPYPLDVAQSDFHLTQIAQKYFSSYEEVEKWIDS
nr:Mariner Mos1 transposase [Hymenolepis microstoma]